MLDWQYCWNPWHLERHVSFAGFRPDYCRGLLKEGTTIWLGAPVGRRILTGDDLWLHRLTFSGNNSRPYARLRCRPPPGGSEVQAPIGLQPAGQVGAAVWFGLLGLWTLGAFGSVVTRQWDGLWFLPVGFAFIGIGEGCLRHPECRAPHGRVREAPNLGVSPSWRGPNGDDFRTVLLNSSLALG